MIYQREVLVLLSRVVPDITGPFFKIVCSRFGFFSFTNPSISFVFSWILMFLPFIALYRYDMYSFNNSSGTFLNYKHINSIFLYSMLNVYTLCNHVHTSCTQCCTVHN